MITTKQLQYTDLLDYVSEEAIAKYYLGIGVNKPFNSFFREDPIPSARLFYYHGRIYYNDFLKSMTLSDLIMHHKRWTYIDLIDNIKKDFMNTGSKVSFRRKVSKKAYNKNTILSVKYRDWESWDDDYWMRGNINRNWLESADIHPIQYYWINGYINVAHKWHYTYDHYLHKNVFRRKLYAPKHKNLNKKWTSNIDSTIIQNKKNLPRNGPLLLIDSSLKDCGVTECNWNIPSIAGNNELSFMPERFVWKLSQRFTKIVTLYDNDKGGHIGANRQKQKFGWDSIFLPSRSNAKDPFNFCEVNGVEDFKRLKNTMLYG